MSGIILLVLAITFSSGVAMTMKAANAKGLHLGQFMAVNLLSPNFSEEPSPAGIAFSGVLSWGQPTFWPPTSGFVH